MAGRDSCSSHIPIAPRLGGRPLLLTVSWRIALGAALTLVASPTAAQTLITLFDRVDQGLRRSANRDPVLRACSSASAGPHTRLERGSRSRLGLRGTDELGLGWKAGYVLDQSLLLNRKPNNGDVEVVTFGDARATVSLSHYAYGRIDLGRRDTPARDVALDADPWGGDTVGSAKRRSFPDQTCNGLPRPQGVSYASPEFGGWSVELQILPAANAEGHRQTGSKVKFERGPWYVALGHHRWGPLTEATSIGIVRETSPWRWYLSAMSGKEEAERRGHVFAGWSRNLGGGELRLGIGRYRSGADGGDRKAAVGYHYALSPRTILYTDIAALRPRRSGQSGEADLGIKVSF